MKKIILTLIAIPILFILVLAVNFLIFSHNATKGSQDEPIQKMDTTRQALLIIDIQEATTGKHSPEEHYIAKAPELITTINQIADSAARRQIPVIYVKSVITNYLLNILNDMYAPDNPGSKLDARLNRISDMVVRKDKSDAFTNPVLDNILQHHKINKLLITGLDLGHCVDATIQAAENRNYEICIINDAVLAKSDSLKYIQLEALQQKGHQVISSAEFLKTGN